MALWLYYTDGDVAGREKKDRNSFSGMNLL